jgi:uroporphyrinogen decarboxylase
MIENREDFANYNWPELNKIQEAFRAAYDTAKKQLPKGVMFISGTGGGILENVMWLMGTVSFFRKLYEDPTLIRDMFRKIGEIMSFCVDLATECSMVGAVQMGDDLGYKSGPMISPTHLRQYVFPWQKKCVDIAHKHGKPFILHSCGNLKSIMDDLINYVGIDAWHSFQDNIIPVTEAKEKYRGRIAILGGVDVDKLSRLPINEIKICTRTILEKCMPGGGYALGSGNSITNYIKIENYNAMLEMGLKYGRY